jgi:hypothetical protein
MKEACLGGKQAFIPHDEAPKGPQPGEGPFDDPAAPLPPQLAPILMRGVLVIAARRDHRLDAPASPARPQGMTIIALIRHQPLGALPRSPGLAGPPKGDGVEGLLEEGDFRRGRGVHVGSQRSPRAIAHHHPLRAFASLGLANLGPPFFAEITLPSAQHASQRSFSRS